ncbi:hypothetical protein PHMEG_00026113 [Phytophthora megakarya]|uniref:Uncharacterized protein n=1 Tax=Phytophthora megakarya TaxID=4795 RepID=A0A225VBK1_9STRA|nr:hypothetical protein PHMEG_00026113 [Phytophthora megakarya]
MEDLTQIVERLIAAEMLAPFGLILDDWSHTSEHFIAFFAWYEEYDVMKPLLSKAPYRTMRRNRAVQSGMQQHEKELFTVQSLMVRLRTLKQSPKLRKKTPLRLHLVVTDDALVDVLPAPVSNKWLRELQNDLKNIAPCLRLIKETTHTATNFGPHADIALSPEGVQVGQSRFQVGDNCAVNRLFTTLLGVPLVGCASHRLNRAVQQDMTQHKDDLAAVQALMIKLWTLTQSAKLCLKTELRPVIRQDPRWSSTFAMVQRYQNLLEFLDAEDDDIMEVMPTPAATNRLCVQFKELKDIEFVSKSLQRRDVDLLDVRQWFDGLIAVKPYYSAYLARIIHIPDFES